MQFVGRLVQALRVMKAGKGAHKDNRQDWRRDGERGRRDGG
jgi:hypothetical protein